MKYKKHYDKDYFKWQSKIGVFGAEANKIKFNDLMPASGNILDFGCGGGYMLASFENINKYGVEINEEAINIATQNEWDENTNEKGILLEDYTGHLCTNCPEAAQIAKSLEEDSSLNVIVASIHASTDGGFQQVDQLFTNNYETEAGNEYVRGSEMNGFLGNPNGTINRNDGGLNNTVWYIKSQWISGVNDENNISTFAFGFSSATSISL